MGNEKTYKAVWGVAGLVAMGCLIGACDESLKTVAGPTPNLEPTFTAIQRDIFQSTDSAGRAACVSCHRPASSIGSLVSDSAYNTLVGAPSTRKAGEGLVIPGDPDRSYLVRKLEGATDIAGRRMPPNPPYLTPGQIEIVRRWIRLGARDN
jgi:hypothetical protein